METKVHLLDFLDYAQKTHPAQAGLLLNLKNRVASAQAIDPATFLTIVMSLVTLFANPASLSGIISQLNAILAALHLPPLPVPA